ncbi:ATP-dependent RNA helicase [Vairimorpha necatrix]|uniref:ATP-dependent RNA helicase n=1 Tax=Vairimorpha necatrix TaxID=6039 RepID=A0AAX4JAP2_9MICR
MIRENVCPKVLGKIKEKFVGSNICEEVNFFIEFLSLTKTTVLGELQRFSRTHKNFVPLVKACRYITKELNKEKPNHGYFIYLENMMGEPARESKDFIMNKVSLLKFCFYRKLFSYNKSDIFKSLNKKTHNPIGYNKLKNTFKTPRRLNSLKYFSIRKNMWWKKVQEQYCIVKIQRIPYGVKDLLKDLCKKNSLLENSIITARKYRRRDTFFTKIIVEKLYANLLIKTVKAKGFKVLNDNRKELEKSSKVNKKTKENIKLLSLNMMKGKEEKSRSEHSSATSDHYDGQNNKLDTEMYLTEHIKHVYADDGNSSVTFKKDGEMKYFLKKIKILSERICKNDFLDMSKNKSRKDLNDLKKFISSTTELVTIQQTYLELSHDKLEKQKMKLKNLIKNNLMDDSDQITEASKNKIEMMIENHSKEHVEQKDINSNVPNVTSSETLQLATGKNDVSNLEIINEDFLINVKNLESASKVEEEDRLSEYGKRMCLETIEVSKESKNITNEVVNTNNVKLDVADINKKAVDNHLKIISAIISGRSKAPKNGVKLYQINKDGWKSVRHTFKPKMQFGLNKNSSIKHTKLKELNRFTSIKVENLGKCIKFHKKESLTMSLGEKKNSIKEKKNSSPKMAKKESQEKSGKKINPVQPQKNRAKGLSKEALIKIIRGGCPISKCKFKFVLVGGLGVWKEHQARDAWAALLTIERKDIPLLKQFRDEESILLMLREGTCERAVKNLLDEIPEAYVCNDETFMVDFLKSKKDLILEELLWVSRINKNFIPLTEACKYIKKNLGSENLAYKNFIYLHSMMGEPARKMKDSKNE